MPCTLAANFQTGAEVISGERSREHTGLQETKREHTIVSTDSIVTSVSNSEWMRKIMFAVVVWRLASRSDDTKSVQNPLSTKDLQLRSDNTY